MTINHVYAAAEPTRAEIEALAGPAVLEFGAPWCDYCQAAQPLMAAAMADHPAILHLKIEDGKGRRLGRSFRVKFWPTLIFLSNGKEIARLVRPSDAIAIATALRQIDASTS